MGKSKSASLESVVIERIHGSTPHKVDREKGIIFGVKISGLKSGNGYIYDDGAYSQESLKHYEGKSVFRDHGAKIGANRSALDLIGWLYDCEIKDREPYGNLRLLNPATDFSTSLMNAAEHKPDLFGLSHEARVKWKTPAKTVAESILAVRSIDIVCDPATTSSLFEQRRNQVTTVGEYVKTMPAKSKERALLEWLCEQEGLADLPSLPLEEPTAVDPDQALKDGFKSAMMAAVEAFVAGDLDSTGMIAKLKELAKMLDKAAGAEPAAEAEAAVAAEQRKLKQSTDPFVADLQEQLRQMQAKDTARDLCDHSGIQASPALLKALVALGDESDMKALIQEHKATKSEDQPAKKPALLPKPKSGHQGTVTESKDQGPNNYDDYCRTAFGQRSLAKK